MQKVIKVEDKSKKIVHVTISDERWYPFEDIDEKTKLPIIVFEPSVTWIISYYPKGQRFYRWLGEIGFTEAEAIKDERGKEGSKIHYACDDLVRGIEVKMNSKYLNNLTGELEELTFDEYDAVISYANWYNDICKKLKKPPILITSETKVRNKKVGYAGTVDQLWNFDGVITILDIKTSKYIWTSHNMQISAYEKAEFVELDKQPKIQERMILQLNYKKNQSWYKENYVPQKFALFLNTKAIWKEETEGIEPKKRDYPMSIKLDVKKKVFKKPVVKKVSGKKGVVKRKGCR